LIYRHTALIATYSINVVFPAIAKAEGPLLARMRHADVEQCPFAAVHRKTFAQAEFFSV
jgi:hypothetical protein